VASVDVKSALLETQVILYCLLESRLKDESPFKDGQIGGHCHFNPSAINTGVHRMSLSTW
jgi:hypothetical protein